MANGRKHIIIPNEIYNQAKKFFEKNKEELKLKNGVRSPGSFLIFCIREYFKEKEIKETKI